MASCPASEWQRVKAALHSAQRKVREPALVILPGWVRPADSFRSEVKSGPELQGVGVGEAVEGADFGGDDATPDFADAGHALQEFRHGGEAFAAAGHDDGVPQRLPLELDELDDAGEVGEGPTLGRLETVSVGQQPALGRGAVELRTAEIGGQQDGLHELLGAGQDAAELSPVSAELAELHQFVVGDVAQGHSPRASRWATSRASR